MLNDNNYPLSAGRNPDQPDDTEAIIVRTDALLPSPTEMPGTGGPPLLILVGPVLALAGAAWVILPKDVLIGSRDLDGFLIKPNQERLTSPDSPRS